MIQLKHLLKTVLRYKLSSGLTLLSLVVAFLGIIMLSLYVSYERSFDKFHKNGDNIYLYSYNGNNFWVPALLLDELKNEIPDIEHGIAVKPWGNISFSKVNGDVEEAVTVRGVAISEDFFRMFNFPLLQGSLETVLSQPKTVVISQELARKVFGDENPLGEYVNLGQQKSYKVTGIMEDMPRNTAFRSDVIISFESFMQPGDDWVGAQLWSEWSFNIFFQLNPAIDRVTAEDKISSTPRVAEVLERMNNREPQSGFVKLIPLKELHFTSGMYFFPSVSRTLVDIFSLLALILVIMGIVNFVNFSTSQAPLRAKSLSIQQILGEKKWRSRLQIIGESVLLSIVALIIALILHDITYNHIQNLFGIQGLDFSERHNFIIWFLLFSILFGIIAGWYPSRYITSPPVSQAVKGKMNFSGKGKGFRQVLITIQFVFTIAMITAALTIEKQLSFWRNFDIGIEKENVIYIYTNSKLQQSHQAFADELMKNGEIVDYTYTQFIPGQVGMGWGRWVDEQYINIKCWPIDDRFFDFFGIKIVEGRPFMKGEGDIDNFVFNEKAVQIFGWENPLEKRLPGFDFEGDILGVAKKFNFSSLKEEVEPMTFWLTNTRKDVLMLRAKSGNYTQLMRFITETAQKFDGDANIEPRFLDDALNQLYDREKNLAHFIEFITLWCVLLALTGLLGLTIFIARDRVKEIGIRKVNGATALEIVTMLNKSIIMWITIASVIATPIAYYAMDKWLQNFAYRTQLSWWVFALAGLLALGIALLTVSWQSWLAARRNPVEALRYE